MQYTSRYVCCLLQWFHQEIRCCSDVLWQNWKPVKNLFFIFNAVDSRHNGHIQNCRQDTIVFCYSTRTIILCTIHTMIYELDKETKNIDFWVVTRKIDRRTPSTYSKMCLYCHVFIFSKCLKKLIDLVNLENHCLYEILYIFGKKHPISKI